MRIPAGAVVAGQCHLHERYAAFDQTTCEQTALAEQTTTIGVAHGRRLLVEVERLGRGRAHQADGPVVSALMTARRDAGMPAYKVALHLLQEFETRLSVVRADFFGRVYVLNAQQLAVI